MFGTKRLVLTAALGLAGLMAIPAYAQDRDHDRDDRDRNGTYNNGQYSRDSQNQAYQQGMKDAQWDRQHGPQTRNRAWRNDYDAQAYRQGYNVGIGNGNGAYRGDRDHDRDHDRDGRWSNNGGYPNGGYPNGGYNNGRGGNNNYASQMGYTDGVNDGAKDRQTGHSYRPTQIYGYKDANHGQSQSGMDKEQYKQLYRQAYLQGYQRGYNNGR